ncbi:MAG: UDP-N-acetylmuramoyl-L-alanyl-D-glutamate--2,6-diaminopimelate ligase [Candidatus Melainabacteria bacterium]|nr:UDP-N-acetylmuramoyl-L-alanyl-D-glutamate--2,6-diaminopimelate ligase [Candidatus Melainabacteria bacterium]
MRLQALLDAVCATLANSQYTVNGSTAHESAATEGLQAVVLGITANSRAVKPGWIFVALHGDHVDGHQYVSQAIEAGALAVVIQADRQHRLPEQLKPTIPVLVVPNTYQAFAELSARFYNEPGRQMQMIGVTGTNGKTTVTHLIERLLVANGASVGLIGTLGHRVLSPNNTEKPSPGYETTHHTTPMADALHHVLAEMKAGGTNTVVMEVSSHALAQYRVQGCDFSVAVFTNLTQDHLDFHQTMDQYAAAKCLLFSGLTPSTGPKTAVINLDDTYADRFLAACPTGVRQLTYSLSHPEALVRASNVRYSITGASFDVTTPAGSAPVQLRLAGQFSVYNALAAIAAGIGLGIALDQIVDTLAQVPGVRGRFEVVAEAPFVIVDYAHTPDGLENVLNAARQVTPPQGKLIVVFGCGGDRDATKRPKMGAIAERLADVLVITSDNPRTEDPQQIITDILSGIQRFEPQRMQVNADRREAIRQAMDLASPHDVIVVAGKGHEDYQILADRTIHFDDREEVQAYASQKAPVNDAPTDMASRSPSGSSC